MNTPYRETTTATPPRRQRFWWWSWTGFASSMIAMCLFNMGAYCVDSCRGPSVPMRDRLEDEAKRHLTRTHPGAVVHVACGVGGESFGDGWGTCNGTVDGRQIQPMTCMAGDGCR